MMVMTVGVGSAAKVVSNGDLSWRRPVTVARHQISEFELIKEVIIMAVKRSLKKHTDNVMRFLEGLSSRLSQLE
ncbi:hypothetical protein Hanom_Chr03g00185281 [Helianthus anomalus]